ncbi:MAG: hypothetical protein JXR95_01835 [Deltaproteobacteria bacterium]|nr:hypothetical protein [Deltaproteobacteria bacterium]
MRIFQLSSLIILIVLMFPVVSYGQNPAPPVMDADVSVQLKNPTKDIFVAQNFQLLITIVSPKNTEVSFPAKIEPGKRFKTIGEPHLILNEKLDSGNEKKVFEITLNSFFTDRLLDLKAGRIQKRINGLESDLVEQKTKLTNAGTAGKDTKSTESAIKDLEQQLASSKKELQTALDEYGVSPIPVSIKLSGSTTPTVIMSHEAGKGPRIIISSKLANDPHPSLKEPASEENIKAGGPFWKPYSIYRENIFLKNLLTGIAIGLVVFALGFFIIRYILKKRSTRERVIPVRPANEIAYERLDILRSRGTPEDEYIKDYAYEISEIVREYFGNRYSFYSLEMTTTELLEKLKEVKPDGITHQEISLFMDKLDLIKFAKLTVTPDESRDYLEQSYDFVRKTWYELTDEELSPGDEPDSDKDLETIREETTPVLDDDSEKLVDKEDLRWAGLADTPSDGIKEKIKEVKDTQSVEDKNSIRSSSLDELHRDLLGGKTQEKRGDDKE